MRRLTCVILISLLIMVTLPMPVFAASESVRISTFKELESWAKNHEETGGTAILTDDINIDNYFLIRSNHESVIIDTGDYSLIARDDFAVCGNVSLRGSGLNAVIQISSGGSFTAARSGQYAPAITATADSGCAVYCQRGGTITPSSGLGPTINAIGNHAIGLRSDTALNLYGYFINAAGGNSTAVYSTHETSLFLCQITSGGISIDAPSIISDTCLIAPRAANTEIITRKITDYDAGSMIYPTGADGLLALDGQIMDVYMHLTDSGGNHKSMVVPARLKAAQGFNPYKPGKYIFDVTPISPLDQFDLISEADLTVTVYDSRIPYFDFAGPDYPSGYLLSFLYTGTDASDITVWSRQQGESEWSNYSSRVKMECDGSRLTLSFLYTDDLRVPMELFLRVDGIGETAIIKLHLSDEEELITDMGGDRGGSDRGNVNSAKPANTSSAALYNNPASVNPASNNPSSSTNNADIENDGGNASQQNNETKSNPVISYAPQTSWNLDITYWILAAVFAAAIIILLILKRRVKNDA